MVTEKMNRIVEVQNVAGVNFRIGETVAHQDKDVGTATITDFEMSKTHEPEIMAQTDQGTAHIDFLEKIKSA